MNDMKSDTHIPFTATTTTNFSFPPGFINAIKAEVAKHFDMEQYVNEVIKKWMDNHFDISDYDHEKITTLLQNNITDDVMYRLKNSIHAEVEIHLD